MRSERGVRVLVKHDLTAAGRVILPGGGPVVRDARVVDDGDRVTAGALTCGIDLGALLAARLTGRPASEIAEGIAHQM